MQSVLDFLMSVQALIVSITAGIIVLVIGKFIETKDSGKIRLKKVFSVTGVLLLILAMVILVTNIVRYIPETKTTPKIVRLHEKVTKMHSSFIQLDIQRFVENKLDEDEKIHLRELQEVAPNVIKDLNKLVDGSLSMAKLILKYDDIAYASAIAAEIESDRDSREEIISGGISAAEKVLYLIKLAEEKEKENNINDYDYSKLVSWLSDNKNKDRAYFVLSWLHAIRKRFDDNVDCTKTMFYWNKVNKLYRDKYPARKNPSIRLCFKSKK